MSIIGDIALSIIAAGCAWAQPAARSLALEHYSHVFGEERNFRISCRRPTRGRLVVIGLTGRMAGGLANT
jgi:hypothetical protein